LGCYIARITNNQPRKIEPNGIKGKGFASLKKVSVVNGEGITRQVRRNIVATTMKL